MASLARTRFEAAVVRYTRLVCGVVPLGSAVPHRCSGRRASSAAPIAVAARTPHTIERAVLRQYVGSQGKYRNAGSVCAVRGVSTQTQGVCDGGKPRGPPTAGGGPGRHDSSHPSAEGPSGTGVLGGFLPVAVRETLSRVCVASTSAVAALMDPERADAVAALGEATGVCHLPVRLRM